MERKMYRFPEVLKKLLKKNKMYQQDLAKEIGKSEATIKRWSTDIAMPKIYDLMAVAEVFDVSLDYLVYGEE